MDLLQMSYFSCVANSETMLHAAQTLNVSQSTLSMSVKRLERELGTELFERTGRRLQLTPAGKRFLDGASKIINEADALKRSMLCSGQERSRTVVLGTDAADFVMEAMTLYTELTPGATFNPVRCDRKLVRSKLLTRQIDLAVTLEPIRDLSVESVLLLSEPMRLLCGARSRFAHAQEASIRQLSGETVIFPAQGSALRAQFDSFFSLAGVQPGLIIEVSEEEALSADAAKNLGITFVPRSNCLILSGNIDRPLFFTPLSESFCYRNIYLSRIKDGSPAPAQAQCFDFLSVFARRTRELEHYPNAGEFMRKAQQQHE